MKKLMVLLLILILSVSMSGCSDSDTVAESTDVEGCEVSFITGPDGLGNKFTAKVWESIEEFANENELGSEYFTAEKATKESYLTTIDNAVDKGAKLVVMAGKEFEITTYEAQKKYENLNFLLIDGVPHSSKNKYETNANSIGVIFAEEEAGYLAGYAAVKDGYSDVAFLGSNETPSIKRYGYGFVQGVAAAAEEESQKIQLKYEYAGTSKASDKVKEKANDMYQNGTEVIFVSGGTIISSVIEAAETSNGKVIGSDIDRSVLSNVVITSAVKNVEVAVEDAIDGYADGKYLGGTAFNYAAKNKGVGLEIDNSKFVAFNSEKYDEILNKLKEGNIKLKKDNEIKSVKSIKNKLITIKE